jgi:hypothetical protein
MFSVLNQGVGSGFPPLPKASARLAEARFAREGGGRIRAFARHSREHGD